MNPTHKSVFLSYASDDAEAAQRICSGLRAAGIDVWFDQSELRGGDAWDQAIRRRVKDCALFIPVVSARTNARSEGYFRLEWRLAVDRSHLMADDQPFIVPVVIDDTMEAGARVPDRFRERHWSRLPGGAVTDAFIQTVRVLMGEDAIAVGTAVGGPVRAPAAQPVMAGALPRSRRWPWVGALCAVAVVAVGLSLRDRFAPADKVAAETASANTDTTAAPAKSIAVLPFLDMSEKRDQEYFSDGLAEELLSLLAQVPDLRVAARTSSFAFRGKTNTVAEIARTLNVAHVLEGSVRKSGKTLRITVQLIRAADGFGLWSQTYERDIHDVFKVQDEIATAVAGALKARLLTAEQKAGHHLTDNPDAHSQYLIGLALADRDSPDGERDAIAAFQRAIALDPGFAAAYAGLARAEQRLDEFVTMDRAGMDRAAAAADKAIALAPELADGYVARSGLRTTYFFDWKGAQADIDKALALEQSSDIAWNEQAYVYSALGRIPEAIAAARRAVELAPLSVVCRRTLTLLLLDDGQFGAAQEEARRMVELTPGPTAIGVQALVRVGVGDAAGVVADGERLRALTGGYFELLSAYAQQQAGSAAAAQRALDVMIKQSSATLAYQIAVVYAMRGDKDKAFEWLDRAVAQHDGGIIYLKRDRYLAPLRADARYTALLKRLGLPA